MSHRGGGRSQVSYRRLSSPMLEEAFQAHGQSGHRFTKKTFTRPTYCHHCTEMLWGFTNQGYSCEVCNFVTHERCLTNVITACVSIATTLVKNPVAHTWGGKSFYRRKFCNVCRKRLDDSESFRCQVCEYFVHDACKEFGISDCKQCATFIPTSNKSTEIAVRSHGHHWREGNFGLGAKCVYCKRSCGTIECLASYRCSWCAQTAHSGCFEMLPKECKFGYLHRLSLPPFCVSLPNIDLWGPWRQSKMGLQSLRGGFVDEDDGIVPDHPSTLSTFSASTSGHSSETQDIAHLEVYDGNIHSPRTCQSIPVPRNVQVNQLLNEALKKFCINDDPNNYYLAKAVDPNNERPLDSEEMPVQFPEHEKRPLIFLRMKSADRRKGYIRIYSGLQIDVPATFKTIPVTASSTVSEVKQLALQKFGIRDPDVDNYVLTEMHLHQGVEERFMQSHESPWKCLMDIRKKSIRQMKFARFYLRRKLEPCGSCCLCIGNLPTYLGDKGKYEAVLDELLKNISDYCEVESVHPSYGMVFVKVPSADLAAEAINILEGSVVDGKDVFVKLLPTVHPEVLPIDCQPLLVFVNPKSGGGQGDDIISAFQRLLNPNQVYNLLDGGPLPGLYAFKDVIKFRILICGGDGTVGWVLSCLDDISILLQCKKPPSAILPLGTGNDLSRVLNWGGGYSSGESPLSLLIAVDHANTGLLDRWFIMFDSADTPLSDTKSNDSAIGMGCNREDEPNMFIMNNYFGIGIDADLCLDFHLKREEAPQKFTSRLHNKGVYLRAGLKKMTKRSSVCLSDEVELEVDGKQIALPAVGGIVFLNIGSWGAGADLWGPYREDDDFSAAEHDDGMIEVVGLTGVMQMGQIQSGMRYGVRIAQGAQINLRLKSELPVQIDGEPWMQSAGQVIIRPALVQAAMLSKRRVKVKQLHQRASISRPTSAPNIANSVFYND